MGRYNFDAVTDRRGSGALKWQVAEGELPMWVADMDFQAAPEIRAALQKRLDHGVFGYSGIPDRWYAAYMNWWKTRHGLDIKREELIFVSGVVPAVSSLVRRLTLPAEKVLVQTPVYNIFFNSIVNNGRIPVQSPLRLEGGRYFIDFERLERELADPQVSLMLLCNPQNPGGRIWSAGELAQIAELCAKYGVKVVSDEIHCDVAEPGRRYVPFASVSGTAAKLSVSCFSPSKAFNIAGLHSAAVFIPEPLLRHRAYRGFNNDEIAEPNAFAVEAAAAAFEEGGEWLDELNAYVFAGKKYAADYIRRELPEVGVTDGEASYLMWLDGRKLPGGGEGWAESLRRNTGLYLSRGSQYGEAGRGFVRLNAACPRSVLLDGLERFKAGTEAYIRENCQVRQNSGHI